MPTGVTTPHQHVLREGSMPTGVTAAPDFSQNPRTGLGAGGATPQPWYAHWWLWLIVGIIALGAAVAGLLALIGSQFSDSPGNPTASEEEAAATACHNSVINWTTEPSKAGFPNGITMTKSETTPEAANGYPHNGPISEYTSTGAVEFTESDQLYSTTYTCTIWMDGTNLIKADSRVG